MVVKIILVSNKLVNKMKITIVNILKENTIVIVLLTDPNLELILSVTTNLVNYVMDSLKIVSTEDVPTTI